LSFYHYGPDVSHRLSGAGDRTRPLWAGGPRAEQPLTCECVHGSFNSGKSHFMGVLHAVLRRETAARRRDEFSPLPATHIV